MPTLQQIIKEWDTEIDITFVNKNDNLTRWGKKIKNRSLKKSLKEADLKSFIHSRDKALLEGVKEIVGRVIKSESNCSCESCKRDIINLINKELDLH